MLCAVMLLVNAYLVLNMFEARSGNIMLSLRVNVMEFQIQFEMQSVYQVLYLCCFWIYDYKKLYASYCTSVHQYMTNDVITLTFKFGLKFSKKS